MKILYRTSVLSGFLSHQHQRLLKFCVRILSRRGHYPKFWLLHGEGICRGISLSGFYELELLQGMASLLGASSSVVLDVGANIGNHTVFFAQRFRQVIAFEPVPENCGLLKANLRLNGLQNVCLIEKGLADRTGDFDLEDCAPETTNQGICFEEKTRRPGRRSVAVACGDDEIEKIGLTGPIGLVKIDVEGAEPLVIGGLSRTLLEHQPLVCWEAFTHADAMKTVERLRPLGYKYLYHLSTRRSAPRIVNRILDNFGKKCFLYPFENHSPLDGMNVASVKALM